MAQKTKKAKRGAAATPTVDQVHSLAPTVPCRSLRSLSQTKTVGHASPSMQDSHACRQQRASLISAGAYQVRPGFSAHSKEMLVHASSQA